MVAVRAERAVSRHCLIIEDSAFDRKMMARVVQAVDRSLAVYAAGSLAEARAVLQRGAVRIILLDNNLPDGKGADFALELSRNVFLASIPIIMVSDWPSPFMWNKAESAGVRCVINKSDFNAETVSATFAQLVAMH